MSNSISNTPNIVIYSFKWKTVIPVFDLNQRPVVIGGMIVREWTTGETSTFRAGHPGTGFWDYLLGKTSDPFLKLVNSFQPLPSPSSSSSLLSSLVTIQSQLISITKWQVNTQPITANFHFPSAFFPSLRPCPYQSNIVNWNERTGRHECEISYEGMRKRWGGCCIAGKMYSS